MQQNSYVLCYVFLRDAFASRITVHYPSGCSGWAAKPELCRHMLRFHTLAMLRMMTQAEPSVQFDIEL